MGDKTILFWFVKITVHSVLKRLTKEVTFAEVLPERPFVKFVKNESQFLASIPWGKTDVGFFLTSS